MIISPAWIIYMYICTCNSVAYQYVHGQNLW